MIDKRELRWAAAQPFGTEDGVFDFHIGSSPAGPAIRELFPLSCIVAVEPIGCDVFDLPQNEAVVVQHAVAKRRREFAAGRIAARRALSEFGIFGVEIPKRSDGSPQWPTGFIGSISHTREHAVAVVARTSEISAIGIDLELSGAVSLNLLPLLLIPQERSWIDQLPSHEQLDFATVIFSAKEAFYKCQYGLSHEWLDFHDVMIRIVPPDKFTAQVISAKRKGPQGEFEGRFTRFQSTIVTGIYLKA